MDVTEEPGRYDTGLSDFYFRDGRRLPANADPQAMAEWARALDRDRKVERTEARPGVIVSTVFLGTDHGWGQTNQPLLYETMVFAEDDSAELSEDEWGYFISVQERYPTEIAARAGHDQIVARVRDT